MKRPKKLSPYVKANNYTNKCIKCKRIFLEEDFIYAPFDTKRKLCKYCFDKNCDTHEHTQKIHPSQDIKQCPKCKEHKPAWLFMFYNLEKRFRGHCYTCHNQESKQWLDSLSPEEYQEYLKEHSQKYSLTHQNRLKGTLAGFYWASQSNAKGRGVKHLFTRETFKEKVVVPKCEVSKAKRKTRKWTTNLERPQEGSDYGPNTTIHCNSNFNYLREFLGISVSQMVDLMVYLKLSHKTLFYEINNCPNLALLTKEILPKVMEWIDGI